MCLKAKIFALYIAHFSYFVLKICINLGKNSLICCKTLNKQRFLVFCLVVSKYVCTFAPEIRTKGNNKHNENNKKQEAARYITGQEEHWTGHSQNAVDVFSYMADGLHLTDYVEGKRCARRRQLPVWRRYRRINRFSPQRRKFGYLP